MEMYYWEVLGILGFGSYQDYVLKLFLVIFLVGFCGDFGYYEMDSFFLLCNFSVDILY